MNNLEVREVNFNGNELLAAKSNDDGRIYVGVKWVCEGIGLSEGQIKAERKRVQEDIVLLQGGRNLVLPTKGGEQEVQAIDIEFLPLWLAKISITPTMKKNNSEVVSKLVQYQLQAKDVLAKAFLGNNLPNMVNEYLSMSDEDKAIAYFQNLKENKILGETLKLQEPKVEKYTQFMDSDGLLNMEAVAKLIDEELNRKKSIGRNTLFKILREKKILQTGKNKYDTSHNIPYQRYIDAKYFEVKAKTYKAVMGNGDIKQDIGLTTYATPKGLEFIYDLLKSELNN